MTFLSNNSYLINTYGNSDYSYISVSQTTDPLDPTEVTNVETTENIISFASKFRTKEIDGELILASDIKLLVDVTSLSVVPDNSGKITDGTKQYQIKSVRAFKTGDVVNLYILQLRE